MSGKKIFIADRLETLDPEFDQLQSKIMHKSCTDELIPDPYFSMVLYFL